MSAALALSLADGGGDLFVRYSILAIVQGLTEFLPVSSSGHLVLAQDYLDVSAPIAVDVALHVGTLVAVLVVYRGAIAKLLVGLASGEWRAPLLLALATVPVAIVGKVWGDELEQAFGEPRLAARSLLLTALILVVGEVFRRRRAHGDPPPDDPHDLAGLSVGTALFIGVAQCLALLPGVSRSGTTIAAGLVVGLRPDVAARVSFLMSVPAITGAAVLKLPELAGDDVGGAGVLAWSMLLAALVGWVALRLLLGFLGRGAFGLFAVYCAALGGGYLALAG